MRLDPSKWVETPGPLPTPCWIWACYVDPNGYGKVWDGERVGMAHRVVYEALVGPIPAGLQIDHLCRNRACVAPAHLEPVTNAVNSRRGAKVVHSLEIIRVVRRLLEAGVSERQVAALTSVPRGTISSIRGGRTWKGVA